MNWNDFPNGSQNFNLERNQNDIPISIPPQNIKVLVEIANSTFDFSIYKKIKMNPNIQKIHDITWRTSPISYQIHLISDKLWVSSELIAQITYSKGNHSKVYNQTLPFPFKKTCNLQYSFPPMIPLSNEKKHYEFIEQQHSSQMVEHYEQIIYNNENPILDINSTKIISSTEIKAINNYSYLLLNIDCEVSYRIFQNQLVKK